MCSKPDISDNLNLEVKCTSIKLILECLIKYLFKMSRCQVGLGTIVTFIVVGLVFIHLFVQIWRIST